MNPHQKNKIDIKVSSPNSSFHPLRAISPPHLVRPLPIYNPRPTPSGIAQQDKEL